MHWVELVQIFTVDAVPAEFRGFVDFQANVEGKELTGGERVAVLRVEGTGCYIPVFIDDLTDIESLERRLEAQEARMTVRTKEDVLRFMGERH